jgi:succinate-semialdehyde dehydrogenase/glutarate-semialdehyde dehydrogenase
MAALKVGAGTNADTECGPMITKKAVDKIDRLVKDAIERGAKVLCGGSILDREGFFYPPTVLSAVSPEADMAHEEIFGPVAPITMFEAEDQAIAYANDTEYGLAAYIYTRDVGRGMRVASGIEAGMIGLNRGLMSDPAAPFGGVKQSGLGREGGQHHGIAEFMEAKYIAVTF